MGLGFDLTRQAYDITPIYIKALNDGFYGELNGNAISLNAGGINLDVTSYYEYDASGQFSGNVLEIPLGAASDAAFEANKAASNLSCKRLITFAIDNPATVMRHGLYQWYQDNNNYERLYIDVTSANTGNLVYDVTIGGVNIYNMTRAITIDSNWHVYEVCFSEQVVTLMQDGSVLGATATNATPMVLTAIEIDIGRVRRVSVGGYDSAIGRIDLFIIRRGLMFSNTNTSHPANPSWSKMYCNGATIVKPFTTTLPFTADTDVLIKPELYPVNDAPQNIPDFCMAGDKLFITGITPNKKVFVITPPEKPSVVLGGVSTVNIGGPWRYAVSYYDPETGQESKLSPWSDEITDDGVNDIRISVGGANNRNRTDAVRAPNRKLYRKDANGVIYYIGMFTNNPGTLTDTHLTANLTNVTNIVNTEDYYSIDTVGLSKVTSVVVTDNGTGTSLAAGTYEWAVSVYDPLLGIESGIVVSNQFTVAVPANDCPLITITHSIALPTHLRFRVYRRDVTTQQFYYALQLSTSPDSLTDQQISAAPQTYTDNLYVQSGLTVLDPSYNKPPACNHAEFHQDRVFYANFDGAKNKIMFTDPSRLDLVRELSSFYVGEAGRPITGMMSFLGDLIIFKENSIFKLSGNTPAEYFLERITSDTGCISHRTIKAIDNILLFVGHRGLHIYDGARVYPVFDDVSDIFRDLVHRQKIFMSAAVDAENGLYLLAYRSADVNDQFDSNDTIYYNFNNDRILVFNYRDWLKSGGEQTSYTEWPLYTSALGEGKIFFDAINRVVFLNLVPQSGTFDIANVRSGFGYFDHIRPRDFGNKSTDLITFTWLGSRVTVDADTVNRLAYITTEVAIEDLTQFGTVNFGFRLDTTLTTKLYTLNNRTNALTKKVSSRSRFIQPYISATVNERIQFVNVTLNAEKVDTR